MPDAMGGRLSEGGYHHHLNIQMIDSFTKSVFSTPIENYFTSVCSTYAFGKCFFGCNKKRFQRIARYSESISINYCRG